MSLNSDRFFKVTVTLLVIAIFSTLAYRLTRKSGDRVTIPAMERFEVVDPLGQPVQRQARLGIDDLQRAADHGVMIAGGLVGHGAFLSGPLVGPFAQAARKAG